MTCLLTALLLFSGLAAFAAHAATLDLDGPGWSILDSKNCPESPSAVAVNGKPAWRFEIEGTCEPRYVLRDASDEVRAAIRGADASLVAKMHIANARLRAVKDGGTNTYATVMLQRKGDNLSGQDEYAHYRQWAFRNRIKLVNGTFTVTIPMDRTIWRGAQGENAPDAAWNDLLANLDKIGVTLGGESDQDHGVKGSAGLYMLEFKVD
jgi:hypothetical protein